MWLRLASRHLDCTTNSGGDCGCAPRTRSNGEAGSVGRPALEEGQTKFSRRAVTIPGTSLSPLASWNRRPEFREIMAVFRHRRLWFDAPYAASRRSSLQSCLWLQGSRTARPERKHTVARDHDHDWDAATCSWLVPVFPANPHCLRRRSRPTLMGYRSQVSAYMIAVTLSFPFECGRAACHSPTGLWR